MYAYNCDVFCDDCGDEIKTGLDNKGIEDTGDTNDYPQYSSQDESDCPEHCADCHEFLENALTSDGYDYAERTVHRDIAAGFTDSVACTVWAAYYDIPIENPNDNCLDGMACPKCNHWDDFVIHISGYAVVTDDGTEDTEGCDWDADSFCKCRSCGFIGKVKDFRS